MVAPAVRRIAPAVVGRDDQRGRAPIFRARLQLVPKCFQVGVGVVECTQVFVVPAGVGVFVGVA